MKIMQLKVGHLVATPEGEIGSVHSFKKDHVVIQWHGVDSHQFCTDEDLKRDGIVLVDGQ